jgi:hypothetical protein
LALSTFAAWRGISVSLIEKPLWQATGESIRWNAVCCGVLFVFLGRFLQRTKRKPHFESAAVHLGWLLILGALVSGSWKYERDAAVYIFLLAVVGAALAWHSFRKQQFPLFAFGILAIFMALNNLVIRSDFDFVFKSFFVSLAAIGLIGLLWKAHLRMKEPL